MCCAYITYASVAKVAENSPLCIGSSTPSLVQLRCYFQTPKIFILSLDREKRSPLSSLILSHPAQTVALGGSVKKFISDHGYIWLLSVVLEFSSCLCVWLYYGNYSTSKPVRCDFRYDSWPKSLLGLLLLIGKFTYDSASKLLEEEQKNTKTRNMIVWVGCDFCITVLHSHTLACKTRVLQLC